MADCLHFPVNMSVPNLSTKVPGPVTEILRKLLASGFEAHIVGGSVRDLLLDREPKDWDIATNAKPDAVQTLFPESFYENVFGTVGIKVPRFSSKIPGKQDSIEEIVQVTTYRAESGYEDNRHPSDIIFVQTIEEDLARRDFTMNAIALAIDGSLIDPFEGEIDIGKKLIRAVGNPESRFGEDALRMLRAVRFYAELRASTSLQKEPFMEPGNISSQLHSKSDWTIDSPTFDAIKSYAEKLQLISLERVSDEFSKIILSTSPAEGVDMLRCAKLLQYIIPEIEEGVGIGQNLHHIYTVYEHNLRALATCPSKKLDVRLAALLHDVGKPRTKRGDGYKSTFYHHEHVGSRMTQTILTRLRFPSCVVSRATLLVDNHLFYYNVGEVTAASVRRLVKKVGLENMKDLMNIRIGDRLGSGTPKAKPYKLRHLEYMIEKVSKDPISVKMLAINGNDLMSLLGIVPGPKIGAILDVLLADVIENPERNTKPFLLERARLLEQEDLDHLRILAKDTIKEKQDWDDQKIKGKHWVQ